MAIISSAIQTFKSLISLGTEKADEYGLESKPTFACPVCDQEMTLCDEKAVERFGLMDARLHVLKCEACGMLADRIYHPSIGYDQTYVA